MKAGVAGKPHISWDQEVSQGVKSLGAAEAGRARDVERHQGGARDAYLFLHREYRLSSGTHCMHLQT